MIEEYCHYRDFEVALVGHGLVNAFHGLVRRFSPKTRPIYAPSVLVRH